MGNVNSEALTLVLSYQLARVDGRNQQAAVIHTARALRNETKSQETYESLGILVTASPADRQAIMQVTTKMFLS